jgi:CDP-6-deoxy-D-xylo-4-hexulose-3-dehydrase
MDGVLALCRRQGLQLIEDSCESLGATYRGRHVGSFGRVGQFSFYYSHHITTLEGGMVVTNDDMLAESLRILRAHGWVRELRNPARHVRAYPDIDPKFLFVNLGYNLRPTEPQGAMGSLQLRKIDGFIRTRRDNAAFFRRALAPYSQWLAPVSEQARGRSSWFGYPMRVRPGAPFGQRDVMAFLRSRGIEVRPLNAGNIAGQPGIRLYPHRVAGKLRRANEVWRSGFTFGNHQHVDRRARRYIVEQVGRFVRSRT